MGLNLGLGFGLGSKAAAAGDTSGLLALSSVGLVDSDHYAFFSRLASTQLFEEHVGWGGGPSPDSDNPLAQNAAEDDE